MRERVALAQAAWRRQWHPYLTSDSAPLSPYRVIWEIDQNIDRENSVVTHDAGAPRDQMVPFYTATAPHSYVGWGKTTHLGFSIPLMIGAKLAMPERFCINLMGDAAFGMSGLDIETSATRGRSDHHGGPQQRHHGDVPGRIPDGPGAVTASPTCRATMRRSPSQWEPRASTSRQRPEMAPALKRAQALNAEGKTVLIDVKTRAENSRAPAQFAPEA